MTPELLLAINNEHHEASRIWNDRYNVGDMVKGLVIRHVHRTNYRLQVIMPDGSLEWLDRKDEYDAILAEIRAKKARKEDDDE